MVRKITKRLIESGSIAPEEREVIEFGLEQAAHSLTGIAAAVLLGWAMGMGGFSLVFLIAFIPLRIYAGGYHAGSRAVCGLVSFFLLAGAFFLISHWGPAGHAALIFGAAEGILICCLAPMDNENHRFEESEKVVYRRRSRMVVLTEIIILTAAGTADLIMLQKTIAMVFFLELILLIISKLQAKA